MHVAEFHAVVWLLGFRSNPCNNPQPSYSITPSNRCRLMDMMEGTNLVLIPLFANVTLCDLQHVLRMYETNVYICIYKQIKWYQSDISFRIVSFSCFLFITCRQNKTYSEEREERRRDIPTDSGHLPSFPPSCSVDCLHWKRYFM